MGDTPFLALHEPRFEGREWEYVKDCLDTGWVSSAGAYVHRFEEALAAAAGTRHAVAVVNGTSALHLALMAVGVSRSDLVIVPALTFIATANAVSYCGASPVFVDSELPSLGMSPDAVDDFLHRCVPGPQGPVHQPSGRRVAACVPMHTFGHPVRMDALATVCEHWGVPVVEDAAEALGSTWRSRPCGSLGRLGTLSFNGNKIVTTGGGGAITTNDDALAHQIRHWSTQAKVPHPWRTIHDEVGYNYRMPNINAALGLAQIERLPDLVARKRCIASWYAEALADSEAALCAEPDGSHSNYWLVCALVPDGRRDEVLADLQAARVGARSVWDLLPEAGLHPGAITNTHPVAQELERRLVSLPSSPQLTRADVERTVAALRR
ncbi:MAG: perosamine synthetase [Myxococcales bacterium]